MAHLIDGNACADQQCARLSASVAALTHGGHTPTLAVILVGENPASLLYVRNKTRACQRVGVRHEQHLLPSDATESAVLTLIAQLNEREAIDAILVQLPLPPQIRTEQVIAAIDPSKDVDGFHPVNVGRLMLGLPGPRPCTPLGIMALLETTGVPLPGATATVVGRSAIVGKPIAQLLINADVTVTMCHSKTRALADHVRTADIVVAAIGRPQYVQGTWIKPGAIVIDVGINRQPDGTIVGDVDRATAAHAGHITPVPGGVGPMTIAMVLQNCVMLAKQRLQ
ncbi:MAG: bifunctional 5,10-methylenetetrahydrofolate dehydrogenase/5,10-methenyltetrahydrofolate cyclohydrolase [Deltaproteobacteria bacterium]|nr:bifunctional 5,10-methylenetetrahydrofolate dehydrogenase/5,10-methenyltetrahydrofolate cyclohydrolase [Deltaproteobacteria bacterium]